jgi:hypothetical protein
MRKRRTKVAIVQDRINEIVIAYHRCELNVSEARYLIAGVELEYLGCACNSPEMEARLRFMIERANERVERDGRSGGLPVNGFLYHATRSSSVASIMQLGLVPREFFGSGGEWADICTSLISLADMVYLSNEAKARRYADEMAEDIGEPCSVLCVDATALDESLLHADEDFIRRRLIRQSKKAHDWKWALHVSPEEAKLEVYANPQEWRRCLRYTGGVAYRGVIPASTIAVGGGEQDLNLHYPCAPRP